MSAPKGSRYTQAFGKMFKSTGRFGAIANRPLSKGQRGNTHVFNPNSGKYASVLGEAAPVEEWLRTKTASVAGPSLDDAVRQVAEMYGMDLTRPDAVTCVPFLLEKAAELLES
jgi:hypothetical protein